MDDINNKINQTKIKIANETDESKREILKELLSYMISFQSKYEELLSLRTTFKKIKDHNQPVTDLIDYGVPQVIYVHRSTSEPSSNHKECQEIPGKLNNLDNPFCDLKKLEGYFSNLLKQSSDKVSCETDIRKFFHFLLDDILILCGLQDIMSIHAEPGITSFKPDFILVTENGVPKGVVEVKKPPSKIISTKKSLEINGQIFDYMMMLKIQHNLKQVFGIVTTYIETEILWLDNDDPLVLETTLDGIKNSTYNINKTRFVQENIPTKLKSLKKERKPTIKNEINLYKRKIYKSDIITQENKNLVKTLCSVIQKMYYTPTNIEVGSGTRSYIQLTSENWFWVSLDSDITPNYNELIDINDNSRLDSPFLLEDLGSGGDGRCWLGFNIDSEVFVLKFFKEETNAYLEQKIWKEAWGFETFLTTLNNKKTLIMPFFKILTEQDWKDSEILTLVYQSCKILGTKKIYHLDLHRRHVAKYVDAETGNTHVVFIDLSRVDMKSEDKSEDMYSSLLNDKCDQQT